ncbi:hypothetical protein PVAND_009990 [Polypedilum vanderplanki]|uniref:Glucose-methanol-choline oxidoreductase C-terminal domain-containing protein n=1 Tax=Polypedilum vanderplanki TaxID=319348 RepID=A0A9J6CEF0_POLVA|nr:hypothetical protein PVAND_009990 [Polypedilum vanderplanki]
MLRVADASIMPFVTSGNTQCPTYTISAYQAQLSKWTTTYSNIFNSKNGSIAPLYYPDIQIITIVYDQFQADFDIILNERYGYKSFIADPLLNATNYYQIVQIMTTLLQPKSRGTIKLNSYTDPYASPIINGNYFSDPNNTDLNILLKGVKAVCDLYNIATMTNKGAQPFIHSH